MKTRLLKKLRKQADKIFIIKEITNYDFLTRKTVSKKKYKVSFSKYKMSNEFSLLAGQYLGDLYLSKDLTSENINTDFKNLEEAVALNAKRKQSYIYNKAKEIHAKCKKVTKVKIINT